MYSHNYLQEGAYNVNGKNYFYSDIMYGLGVNNDKYDEIAHVFKDSAKKIADYIAETEGTSDLEYARLVFDIMSCKADLLKKLCEAYKAGYEEYLKLAVTAILPEL